MSLSSKKGFTLIELLVVVAIIGIMIAVVFFGRDDGRERQIAKSVANEIASSFRQIQVWGTGTRTGETEGGESIGPDDGYGLSFEKESPVYVLFADLNHNNEYDESGDELFMEHVLTKGYRVLGICSGSGENDCDSKNDLSLVVRRPELSFLFDDEYAEIEVGRGDRAYYKVAVWSNGRFEVKLVQDED